jgi:hypothetical protein
MQCALWNVVFQKLYDNQVLYKISLKVSIQIFFVSILVLTLHFISIELPKSRFSLVWSFHNATITPMVLQVQITSILA